MMSTNQQQAQMRQYDAAPQEPFPNPSGIQPRGRALLVKPYEPPKIDGLIVIPEHVQKQQDTMNQRAVVIAVGESCWHDEPSPRARPGEKVLVTKYAGFNVFGDISLDGEHYRLVNDRDVFAAIVEERQNG